ncbi:TIGR01777 family protein [Frankia sp. CNm7]|uniref:TIGR01777 family oxidoreductase n=1 Tax=Frankia nepalensis TaxID=1836974 RepID=A0A937R9V4_9ACTN|nr:TIGR01777 family oxidoreductase [Frankia nepalensis]MBL7502538.1 TIGR01777 family protein [Frankia nepalensis]MBL7516507.1 TIGR01777 family protein [Frankia nepalensis]MBL7517889.1 TIGR01777 family protein [Frankia nepalensis]MBL7625797.1 TIGR01777 family oxidoreductase [Frankia nepalensis]
MRIVVSGASGVLGSALVPALRADGHEVITLVRRPPRGPDEVRWNPGGGELDRAALGDVDAAVHLAGAGIGDRRWTADYRREILDSRVQGTRLLATTLAAGVPARSAAEPVVLLSSSAVGWYGTAADDPVDESAPAGTGFLADIVRAWEESATPAAEAGVRVCLLRTGPVLAASGGILARQLPLFRLGVGGRLGSGRQWVSWIGLDDWVAAVRFLLAAGAAPDTTDAATGMTTGASVTERGRAIAGPVNLVAPCPVTGAEFARALGAVLRRPAVLPVPRLALRAVVGEFADEGVLASQRVVPRVLTDAGFQFQHPELAGALRALLAR